MKTGIPAFKQEAPAHITLPAWPEASSSYVICNYIRKKENGKGKFSELGTGDWGLETGD